MLCYRKGGFFVDLFVRVSNQVAVNMYKRLGYSVYRTVIEYYSASNGEPDEDAYGELFACLMEVIGRHFYCHLKPLKHIQKSPTRSINME